MPNIKIVSMGKYLPKNKILSFDLDAKLGLSPGSVEKKSGLISRHFSEANETTSFMGAAASLEAIRNANIELTSIDVIVSACGAGEQPIPSTASLIQKQLGLGKSGVACFDINSTCLSFLTAIDILSYLISNERFKRALIVSSDIPSAGINWQDMETCTIFGDGAAACIIEKSDGSSRILSSFMETHSLGSDYCRLEAGGTRIPPARPFNHRYGLFYMDGKKVFKLASQLVVHTQEVVFKKAGLTIDDIDWFVPHQASLLAMHHIRKKIHIAKEKFVDIYATHGNQMAASIPTALYTLIKEKKLKRGQLIYLMGTGAGLSSSGMIMRY
jgi:3-oxoacyl-[acyl-carrier-protein] synthase-3